MIKKERVWILDGVTIIVYTIYAVTLVTIYGIIMAIALPFISLTWLFDKKDWFWYWKPFYYVFHETIGITDDYERIYKKTTW